MKPGVKSRFPCVAIDNENGKRSTGVPNHNFHYMSLIFVFGLAFTASPEYPR